MTMAQSGYGLACSRLFDLYDEAKQWSTSAVNITVATSLDSETTEVINLCETLDKTRIISKTVDDSTCYFLPSTFNDNSVVYRRNVLAPFFARSCKDAGFAVMMKGWFHKRSRVYFSCKRGRSHLPTDLTADGQTQSSNDALTAAPDGTPAKQRTKRVATISRPVAGEEHTCAFGFCVFWHPELKRWYLPKKQGGSPLHSGHVVQDPAHVRMLARSIGVDELELQQQMLKSHHRPRGISRVTFERTGIELEKYQIKYLKNRMRGADLLTNAQAVYGEDFDDTNYEPTC